MGYEPENTLRSFETALSLGVDAVEFDVRLCGSGEVVVLHDATLERTTNGAGYLCDMPLCELRKLDAGKGEKVPLLSEVLDLLRGKAVANIEIKEHAAVGPVCAMLRQRLRGRKWKGDDFLISSYRSDDLEELRQSSLPIKYAPLLGEGASPRRVHEAAQKGAWAVHLEAEYFSPEYVAHAHRNAVKLLVHVVNEVEEMQSLKAAGVHGVITDYPDRLRQK